MEVRSPSSVIDDSRLRRAKAHQPISSAPKIKTDDSSSRVACPSSKLYSRWKTRRFPIAMDVTRVRSKPGMPQSTGIPSSGDQERLVA